MKVYNCNEFIGSVKDVKKIFEVSLSYLLKRLEADKKTNELEECDKEGLRDEVVNHQNIIADLSNMDNDKLVRVYGIDWDGDYFIDNNFDDITYDYDCCDGNEDFFLEYLNQ